MTQSINEQIGTLSAVEAKGHFFTVGLEMLRAYFMPRSHDAALQEGECGFNGIGVDVALCIDAELVTNRFVASILSEMTRRAAVGIKIVGVKHFNIFTDILADVFFKCSVLYIFGMEEAEIAAALTDSNYDFFVVVSRLLSLSTVYTADKCFVHFDFPAQHRLVNFNHCGADSVAEIPCGLVADSKRALNLTGRHSFLRFTEKQRSHKPLAQGQVRIVEDRTSRNRELVITSLAVEQFPLGFQFDGAFLASQAAHAIGPAETREKFAASFVSGKASHYVC